MEQKMLHIFYVLPIEKLTCKQADFSVSNLIFPV